MDRLTWCRAKQAADYAVIDRADLEFRYLVALRNFAASGGIVRASWGRVCDEIRAAADKRGICLEGISS